MNLLLFTVGYMCFDVIMFIFKNICIYIKFAFGTCCEFSFMCLASLLLLELNLNHRVRMPTLLKKTKSPETLSFLSMLLFKIVDILLLWEKKIKLSYVGEKKKKHLAVKRQRHTVFEISFHFSFWVVWFLWFLVNN